MKRVIFLFAVACIVVLAGCPAKQDPAVVTADPVSTTDGTAAAPANPAGNTAYVIRHNAGLYELDGGNVMTWIAGTVLGDKLVVSNETRTGYYGAKKTEYQLVKVNVPSLGKDYWMITWQLAATERLGVVTTDDVFIAKAANVANLSSLTVNKLQVCAILGEEGDFYKVSLYSEKDQTWVPNTWGLPVAYLSKSKVSLDDADIQTAIRILVAEGKTAKDAETVKKQRKAIYEDTLSKYPTSVFVDIVSQKMAELEGLSLLGGLTFSGDDANPVAYTVSAQIASIYASADINSGSIMDLPQGETVSIGKKSNAVTVDGETIVWCHVLSPVDGWIKESSISK